MFSLADHFIHFNLTNIPSSSSLSLFCSVILSFVGQLREPRPHAVHLRIDISSTETKERSDKEKPEQFSKIFRETYPMCVVPSHKSDLELRIINDEARDFGSNLISRITTNLHYCSWFEPLVLTVF